VERAGGPVAQPGQDLAAHLDAEGDLRRLEAALLHPGDQSAGLVMPVAGGQDEQAAGQAAQRGRDVLRLAVGHFFFTASTMAFSMASGSTSLTTSRLSLSTGRRREYWLSRLNTKTRGTPSLNVSVDGGFLGSKFRS